VATTAGKANFPTDSLAGAQGKGKGTGTGKGKGGKGRKPEGGSSGKGGRGGERGNGGKGGEGGKGLERKRKGGFDARPKVGGSRGFELRQAKRSKKPAAAAGD
jgi:hypothetical protein